MSLLEEAQSEERPSGISAAIEQAAGQEVGKTSMEDDCMTKDTILVAMSKLNLNSNSHPTEMADLLIQPNVDTSRHSVQNGDDIKKKNTLGESLNQTNSNGCAEIHDNVHLDSQTLHISLSDLSTDDVSKRRCSQCDDCSSGYSSDSTAVISDHCGSAPEKTLFTRTTSNNPLEEEVTFSGTSDSNEDWIICHQIPPLIHKQCVLHAETSDYESYDDEGDDEDDFDDCNDQPVTRGIDGPKWGKTRPSPYVKCKSSKSQITSQSFHDSASSMPTNFCILPGNSSGFRVMVNKNMDPGEALQMLSTSPLQVTSKIHNKLSGGGIVQGEDIRKPQSHPAEHSIPISTVNSAVGMICFQSQRSPNDPHVDCFGQSQSPSFSYAKSQSATQSPQGSAVLSNELEFIGEFFTVNTLHVTSSCPPDVAPNVCSRGGIQHQGSTSYSEDSPQTSTSYGSPQSVCSSDQCPSSVGSLSAFSVSDLSDMSQEEQRSQKVTESSDEVSISALFSDRLAVDDYFTDESKRAMDEAITYFDSTFPDMPKSGSSLVSHVLGATSHGADVARIPVVPSLGSSRFEDSTKAPVPIICTQLPTILICVTPATPTVSVAKNRSRSDRREIPILPRPQPASHPICPQTRYILNVLDQANGC